MEFMNPKKTEGRKQSEPCYLATPERQPRTYSTEHSDTILLSYVASNFNKLDLKIYVRSQFSFKRSEFISAFVFQSPLNEYPAQSSNVYEYYETRYTSYFPGPLENLSRFQVQIHIVSFA